MTEKIIENQSNFTFDFSMFKHKISIAHSLLYIYSKLLVKMFLNDNVEGVHMWSHSGFAFFRVLLCPPYLHWL